MKWDYLMNCQDLNSLEFRDEEQYKRLNKTAACSFIKEVPFKGHSEPQLSQKEKMIAEMKAKFSAPIVP